MTSRTAGPAVTSPASLPSLLTYSQGSMDAGAGEAIAIPGQMRQLEESLVDAVLVSARHTARYCAGARGAAGPSVEGANLSAPHSLCGLAW
jgi:hypothetical protein